MGKRETTDTVTPMDFPGLRGLAWNRDPARPMSASEAFALYERDWRHVDLDGMTEPERLLLSDLTERFGHGAFLG